jgi:hypothetical protein
MPRERESQILKTNLLRYQTHLQFTDPPSTNETQHSDVESYNNGMYRYLDPYAPEIVHSREWIWWAVWRRYLQKTKTYNDIRHSFRIIKSKERIETTQSFLDSLVDIFHHLKRDRLLLKKQFQLHRWMIDFISLFIEIVFTFSYLAELQHNHTSPCRREFGNCYFMELPSWITINRSSGSFIWLLGVSVIKLLVILVRTIGSDNPFSYFFKPITLIDFITSLPFIVLSGIQNGQFICIVD